MRPLLLASLVATGLAAPLNLLKPYHRPSGCGVAPRFAPGQYNDFCTRDAREYRVWLPHEYDPQRPTPLILVYHGATRNISSQMDLDRLTDAYFNTDHMVVYLQGSLDATVKSAWEGAPLTSSNDIAFTKNVLDEVEQTFCIDRHRVYATGKSQGGGFVGRLACDRLLSRRIAAFAPVSGAYYIRQVSNRLACAPRSVRIPCDARRAVPILAFHGGDDDTIAYHGAFRKDACLPSVQHWAEQWASRNRLGTGTVNMSIPGSVDGVVMAYGDSFVKLVYDGSDVGHHWPATFANADNQGQVLATFNATTWIMGFFRGHRLA